MWPNLVTAAVDRPVGGWAQKRFWRAIFMSLPKRSPERAAFTLHEELPITPTWRANCQMVRSGQPTGVLIPVVYLFSGKIGS
jgi:hypothetical protein